MFSSRCVAIYFPNMTSNIYNVLSSPTAWNSKVVYIYIYKKIILTSSAYDRIQCDVDGYQVTFSVDVNHPSVSPLFIAS